jgi:folate-binding protein YgfZ
MVQALRDLQTQGGATLTSGELSAIPASFGNDEQAIAAAKTGVALYDCSHWGRILVGDSDRIRFLHNQTTNDFQRLQPGQGCDTVFVNSTGRTLDLVTAYMLDDAVLLLTSPQRRQFLLDWMDRFIFFADKVSLTDMTTNTVAFRLIGPESGALVGTLGAGAIAQRTPDQQAPGNHITVDFQGQDLRIAVGSGLNLPGYTLIADASQAVTLWHSLTAAGATPMGELAWERLRVEQGRPVPEAELTEEFNPLEAGLWHTISLNKGCYIGQETIARLHTYRGVKQQLWGVRLNAAVAPGTVVMAGEEKIGKLTSCTATDGEFWGLAYIRTKAVEPGLQVQIGDATGELVAVPFVSHEYP